MKKRRSSSENRRSVHHFPLNTATHASQASPSSERVRRTSSYITGLTPTGQLTEARGLPDLTNDFCCSRQALPEGEGEREVRVLRLERRSLRFSHGTDVHGRLHPSKGLPDRMRHVLVQEKTDPAQAGFPVPATRRARRFVAISRRRTTTFGKLLSCAARASVPKVRQRAR